MTTEERKPLQVPETVHINIAAGNLKDYVGPPVYYRDRLYTTAPPSGVSTGLGYLGNGSGAVMPIEAAVGAIKTNVRLFSDIPIRVCPGRDHYSSQENSAKSSAKVHRSH